MIEKTHYDIDAYRDAEIVSGYERFKEKLDISQTELDRFKKKTLVPRCVEKRPEFLSKVWEEKGRLRRSRVVRLRGENSLLEVQNCAVFSLEPNLAGEAKRVLTNALEEMEAHLLRRISRDFLDEVEAYLTLKRLVRGHSKISCGAPLTDFLALTRCAVRGAEEGQNILRRAVAPLKNRITVRTNPLKKGSL